MAGEIQHYSDLHESRSDNGVAVLFVLNLGISIVSAASAVVKGLSITRQVQVRVQTAKFKEPMLPFRACKTRQHFFQY